jgi:hypothetical protein
MGDFIEKSKNVEEGVTVWSRILSNPFVLVVLGAAFLLAAFLIYRVT